MFDQLRAEGCGVQSRNVNDVCNTTLFYPTLTACGQVRTVGRALFSSPSITWPPCLQTCLSCLSGDTCQSGGRVIMVCFAVLVGAMGLGQAGPGAGAVASGRGASYKAGNSTCVLFAGVREADPPSFGKQIMQTIKRKPAIDASQTDAGSRVLDLAGDIVFDDVSFKYPTRGDANVLSHIKLVIEGGRTTAIVGASGSGKSTIVQLIERFYDTDSGRVSISGVDVKDINIQHLRGSMGLVSQAGVD